MDTDTTLGGDLHEREEAAAASAEAQAGNSLTNEEKALRQRVLTRYPMARRFSNMLPKGQQEMERAVGEVDRRMRSLSEGSVRTAMGAALAEIPPAARRPRN